ncbi:D-alanine--D-alanine ligase [Alkalicella caledoniensis]|uniref:D-alanine--D-alanine ligase n=1 Tax=Alkalicella caledoniensis TaxID=2731377 RepID=A0A7G9WBR8_ALKCA|nr:D-alanine--D-alanine ligase family protein [Alkalicella caledoniensis]QNO16130.1 D-alanine--D-alanine ligase [Alkalicella caledoniensis]
MKNIAVIFGGKSGEHEVSLQSAKFIMEMIDKEKHNVVPVGISKDGQWYTGDDVREGLLNKELRGKPISIKLFGKNKGFMVKEEDSWRELDIDLVFPVLHGTYGEDGTLQGMLDLLNIPYVGSGVLGSSVAMDKGMMKEVFKSQGLPVGPYVVFNKYLWDNEQENQVNKMEELGYPLFVKPANLGSSVGISKAKNREQLLAAVEEAFQYDLKLVVEKGLKARELECSVLGNDDLFVSTVGEIVPGNEFYDYNAKYIDDNSEIIIPADLPEGVEGQVQELAKLAFKGLDCLGLSRVDFFFDEDGKVWINEVNTLPGFTSISMYPKLLEASGVTAKDLVKMLIDLALNRHGAMNKLRRDY